MTVSVVIFVLALIGSGIISSSETALLAVNKFRMRRLAAEGDSRAVAVMRLMDDHEKFFGAILLANNVVNMLLAAVGTSLAIALLGNTPGVVALSTVVTTTLLVIFGELTPKSLANILAEQYSLFIGRFIYALMVVSAPLVYVFTLLPKAITHLIGGRDALTTPSVTEDELRMLIDMGETEGTVETRQGRMLENIFRFGETTVREVMTPRPEIKWVANGATLGEFLDLYHQHAHTRFPVYEDDLDDVVGVLSVKDVVRSMAEGARDMDQPVTRLMRAPLFVPETKRVDELFTMMRHSGHKMALVVDEFGGIAGLATQTQMLERIVGRTGEEGARPKEPFITVGDNTYELDGNMTVDEANHRLGLDLPEGDYETIAGLILEQAQRIPQEGERFRVGNVRLQVREMEETRVAKVRARIVRQQAEAAQSEQRT